MSYASNIEEINSTRRKINISVAANSVQDALNSITNEMQTTAEIRGFRKGKAPLTIIRKFYMNDIVKKAADKIINDAYNSSIKELDFQIVSHPHIEPENQFNENSEFKFSATVDINPKLEMVDYKDLSIELPATFQAPAEDQYEKLIQSYQKAFSQAQVKAVEGEAAAEGNQEALVELNDDFAKRLGYETMEIAKTKICESLNHSAEEMKVNAAFEQIVDQVLAKNSFEVAESLVESTIDRAIQETNSNPDKSKHVNPENKEHRAQFYDMALKNVRGILALGHIARQEGVTVSDDEMYRDLSNYAMANRIDPRELFKNGTQVIDEFRGQAMIRKVILKLLETAKVKYTEKEESAASAE